MPQEQPRKKAARRKPKGKREKMTGGGSSVLANIFSTLHPMPTPVAQACGTALPFSGVSRFDFNQSTDRTIIFAANTGTSAMTSLRVTLGGTPGLTLSNIPVINASDSTGGPTSGKAMKLSLDLVNSTSLLNMGGRVTVLNARQRVLLPAAPASMSSAQWNLFIADVRNHPDARSYGGADFREPKMFLAHPVDDGYNEFEEWLGTTNADRYCDHFAVWSGSVPQKRRMSTIIMVFESPPSTQEYTVSIRSSYYTRWPLSSVPGQTQRQVPTAPLTVINAHAISAESMGSDAVPVPPRTWLRRPNVVYAGGAGR